MWFNAIATAKPVESMTPNAMASQPLGVIMHVQEGNGSLFDWFGNAANGVSSHFWIAKDGRIEQYIDTKDGSWAQVAGNSQYLSVETEGFHWEALTDAQVKAFAVLYHMLANQYALPYKLANAPGEKGLGWHGMGGIPWGGHFDCPGYLRLSQRMAILSTDVTGVDMITSQDAQMIWQVSPNPGDKQPDMQHVVSRTYNMVGSLVATLREVQAQVQSLQAEVTALTSMVSALDNRPDTV